MYNFHFSTSRNGAPFIRTEESECKQICLCNCDYFHFAKEYFPIIEKNETY